MVDYIKHNNSILAIIIRNNYSNDNIEFFTPGDFSQQLGYMKRPKDYSIEPHVHNIVERKVNLTQEVLYIKRGKIRVDFYNDEKNYIESNILKTGDVILLASGGHGFKMLEESEIIEVKQGPYSEQLDKVRFDSIEDDNIKLKI